MADFNTLITKIHLAKFRRFLAEVWFLVGSDESWLIFGCPNILMNFDAFTYNFAKFLATSITFARFSPHSTFFLELYF